MTEDRSTSPSRSPGVVRLPTGARPWLLIGTALSGLAFGWAALVLPWRPAAPLALLAWALALLHLCTAVTLGFRPLHVGRPLRLLGFASVLAAPIFVYAISRTSVEMVAMYGSLGWALTAALAAIAWLLVLGTVPVGVFGVYVTRSRDDGA